MVTFAQAQERAERWINGDVPAYYAREVKVREFALGFVAWSEPREDGPKTDDGAVRLVIARDSGEATLWPALPVGEVIRRYEEEYGAPPRDAAPPAAQPPERIDLEATSFLLSPPQWLQDAADRIGIPDNREAAASAAAPTAPLPTPAPTVPMPTPAPTPTPAPVSTPAPPAPTPWRNTNTADDAGSVAPPATVFAAPPVSRKPAAAPLPPPSGPSAPLPPPGFPGASAPPPGPRGASDIAEAETSKAERGSVPAPPPPGPPGRPAQAAPVPPVGGVGGGYVPTQAVRALNHDGPPPPPPPPPAPGVPRGAVGAPVAAPVPLAAQPGGMHHAATMMSVPGGTPPPPPPAPHAQGGYGYPQPPAGVPIVGPGYMAVLRYRAQDGSEQQLIRRSAPGTPHPEWQILHELRALGVPPQQVLELHTELESCDLPGGYCARMIRETWPQVRISHTAPYGKDHAGRQQGVQHLLTHLAELHQVAGAPAIAPPQRLPLPHPAQVQRMPPIPLDGIGHELAQAFGPQGVFRFDQRAVSRQGVPEIVAQTLTWSGLPVDFGPFFWAQAQPGRPVPTLAELAAERGVPAGPDAGSYLVMGNDFGRQLCVQYGTAHIVAVPLEAAPGGQPAVPQFVNSSLPEFARCLALLGRMWRLRLGLTPDQAGRWTVDLQNQLAALDPAAVASPDHWWAVLIEQMWDGLL
ncbi:SUKH-4 family immunity protein [Streptomyces sp. NBC_01262]|uniref:SUKH-4 family immunity protein n=1 Tax=Streptomyces sp. NBC_01262 TaxID=2903803 RepID=UPI002E3166F3|nr:SUKH-4 family immunity protein [Streptomyces sp. NBC_01262]